MTSRKQARARAKFKKMVKVRAKKMRRARIKRLRAEIRRLQHKR